MDNSLIHPRQQCAIFWKFLNLASSSFSSFSMPNYKTNSSYICQDNELFTTELMRLKIKSRMYHFINSLRYTSRSYTPSKLWLSIMNIFENMNMNNVYPTNRRTCNCLRVLINNANYSHVRGTIFLRIILEISYIKTSNANVLTLRNIGHNIIASMKHHKK